MENISIFLKIVNSSCLVVCRYIFKDKEEGKKEKNNKSQKEQRKLVACTRSPKKKKSFILSLSLGWNQIISLSVL